MNSETLDIFGTDPELQDCAKLKGGLEWNKCWDGPATGEWGLIDQYQPTNITIHHVGGNCPITLMLSAKTAGALPTVSIASNGLNRLH